jgi:hypothetical protein
VSRPVALDVVASFWTSNDAKIGCFDISSDSYRKIGAIPEEMCKPSLCVVKGKIYLIGQNSTKLWEVDTKTENLTSFPGFKPKESIGLIIGLEDTFLYWNSESSDEYRVENGILSKVCTGESLSLRNTNFWQRDAWIIGRYAYIRNSEAHVFRIDLKEREMSVIYHDINH